MLIESLYSEIEKSINYLKLGKTDLSPFESIATSICDLISKRNITYKNLSNKGELHNHFVNVAILGGKLGILYDANNLYDLILGCLLHDIGKLYIDEKLLNKKGPLTKIEKIIIDKHTLIGYEIANYYKKNEKVKSIILEHHTIFDKITKDTDISTLESDYKYPLLCGMADIIDAVLSYRPYKKPLLPSVIVDDFNKKGLINYKTCLTMLLGEI